MKTGRRALPASFSECAARGRVENRRRQDRNDALFPSARLTVEGIARAFEVPARLIASSPLRLGEGRVVVMGYRRGPDVDLDRDPDLVAVLPMRVLTKRSLRHAGREDRIEDGEGPTLCGFHGVQVEGVVLEEVSLSDFCEVCRVLAMPHLDLPDLAGR